MRVVVTVLDPECHHGVGRLAVDLVRALKGVAPEDEVLPVRPTLEGRGLDPVDGSCIAAPAWAARGIGKAAWLQLALPHKVAETRPDVLHCTSYVAPLATQVPLVVTVHDLFALHEPSFCRVGNRLHLGVLLARSIRKARIVVTPSWQVRAEVERTFPEKAGAVEVVPPAPSPEFFSPVAESIVDEYRLRRCLPNKFVLHVGAIEPKKNLPRLLAALEVLRLRTREEWPLVITGGGDAWGPGAEKVVRARAVRRLGHLRREELPLLYRAATVVTLPSLAEGFGLPVIEAMACGVPVVCSAIPAALETDPEAVVLVSPADVGSIADGIERAFRDETLRASLIARGCAAVRDASWSAIARRMWSIYAATARSR